jgi:hypothetical protein
MRRRKVDCREWQSAVKSALCHNICGHSADTSCKMFRRENKRENSLNKARYLVH